MEKDIEPECLSVEVGDRRKGFAIGDFLNAIDSVYKYFDNQRDCNSDTQYAEALILYANTIKED